MFKFNFFCEQESEENTVKVETNEDPDNVNCVKESKCIEITKEQYMEIQNKISEEKFKIFESNDVEFGYLSHLGLTDDKGSDLISGEYEGGFKIWECTYDLANYFTSSQENIFKGRNSLELGCSAGIVGLLALSSESKSVHFQDYNEDVLRNFTIPNVVNWCEENDRPEYFSRCAFYSGDWASFRKISSHKYDIILTSETIYNPKSYVKLMNFFKEKLEDDGKIYLAAKCHYFGVGGNIIDFCKLLANDGEFQCKTIWKSDDGLQREILLIKRQEGTNKE